MTRANARELAIHLIYSISFTDDEPASVISTRLNKRYYSQLADENQVYVERPTRPQVAYLDTVVPGVVNRAEELNTQIQKYSIGWDINRISKLTRCILQLALFEIMYVDDVPTGVAIAEAVRIAKLYDGDDTGAFVNGVLGGFARELSAEVTQ